jgi:hypothetical protein
MILYDCFFKLVLSNFLYFELLIGMILFTQWCDCSAERMSVFSKLGVTTSRLASVSTVLRSSAR